MMDQGSSANETTVIATYSTRRDAEMALGHLKDEDIRAHIVADDAGGMHPHLQQTHGVKLVVLADRALRAREILEQSGTLPEREPEQATESLISQTAIKQGVGTTFLGLGLAMLVLGAYGMFAGETVLGLIVGLTGAGLSAAGTTIRRRKSAAGDA